MSSEPGAQHVASYGHANVLMGPLWYTSWVENGQAEVDMGFGYDCGQANTFFKRRIASWTNNDETSNATSTGELHARLLDNHVAASRNARSLKASFKTVLQRKQTEGSKFGLEEVAWRRPLSVCRGAASHICQSLRCAPPRYLCRAGTFDHRLVAQPSQGRATEDRSDGASRWSPRWSRSDGAMEPMIGEPMRERWYR